MSQNRYTALERDIYTLEEGKKENSISETPCQRRIYTECIKTAYMGRGGGEEKTETKGGGGWESGVGDARYVLRGLREGGQREGG